MGQGRAAVQVELVRVSAADGVRLDGALRNPAEKSSLAGADSAIVVHGTGGNFYSSTLLDTLGQRLATLGLTTLQINTRGHDALSTAHTPGGGRMLGAAFEIVADAALDLAAWAELLADRGGRKIVLVGHSLGAVKAAYWLAREAPERVVALVAVSAPRIAYSALSQGSRGEEFLRDFAAAERHVAEGRPDHLMEIRFPLAYFVSAAGFLDKYGRDERYDVLQTLSQVRIPWMTTYAELELSGAAFAGLPDACRELGGDLVIVQGTDHFYNGARQELADHVERWLRRTLGGGPGDAKA